MSTCPECGGEYTPQGMYGHLRMGHGLRGEELEQVYGETKGQEAMAQAPEEEPEPNGSGGFELPQMAGPSENNQEPTEDRAPAGDREPVERAARDGNSRVEEATDRLRRAKQKLRTALEETGEEKERGGGAVTKTARGIGRFFGVTSPPTVERTEAEEELCRKCREEVQAAERELEKALEHEQVDRRYDRADT